MSVKTTSTKRNKVCENIAIIPARSGSKRLPGKNIKNFFGRPIIAYTIEAALASKCFDKVHVSTDSEEIANISRNFGVDVAFLRDEIIATDKAPLTEVVQFVLKKFYEKGKSYKLACLLFATSPLRTSTHISNALRLLKEKKADSVIGVSNYFYSPYRALIKNSEGFLEQKWPQNEKVASLPSLFVNNGSMVWLNVETFLESKTFFNKKMVGYEMPQWSSIDIDTEADWELLCYYYRKYILDKTKSINS